MIYFFVDNDNFFEKLRWVIVKVIMFNLYFLDNFKWFVNFYNEDVSVFLSKIWFFCFRVCFIQLDNFCVFVSVVYFYGNISCCFGFFLDFSGDDYFIFVEVI